MLLGAAEAEPVNAAVEAWPRSSQKSLGANKIIKGDVKHDGFHGVVSVAQTSDTEAANIHSQECGTQFSSH